MVAASPYGASPGASGSVTYPGGVRLGQSSDGVEVVDDGAAMEVQEARAGLTAAGAASRSVTEVGKAMVEGDPLP